MTYLCLILLLSLADASVAPALYHVDRFPQDRATIGTLLEFNRHYRQHLCRLQLIHPDSPTLSIICCETDRLHHVWDLLRDAKYIYYTSSVRRKALGELLNELGYEAFMMGQMPSHVPVWRFTWLR